MFFVDVIPRKQSDYIAGNFPITCNWRIFIISNGYGKRSQREMSYVLHKIKTATVENPNTDIFAKIYDLARL